MAGLGPVFLDTSVLVAGMVDMGPASAGANRVLDAVAEGLIPEARTAWHCCMETYSVLTRLPAEYKLTAAEAAQLLQNEILPCVRVFQLPETAFAGLLAALAGERVTGGRVYDVHIAEVARLAGSGTVLTTNRRHFVSLLSHGIRVLTPEEFVEHENL